MIRRLSLALVAVSAAATLAATASAATPTSVATVLKRSGLSQADGEYYKVTDASCIRTRGRNKFACVVLSPRLPAITALSVEAFPNGWLRYIVITPTSLGLGYAH
jgi:hypothetical protein